MILKLLTEKERKLEQRVMSRIMQYRMTIHYILLEGEREKQVFTDLIMEKFYQHKDLQYDDPC